MLYLVIKEFNAQCFGIGFRRIDVDYFTPHPEGGAVEFHVIAFVLQLSQPVQDVALVDDIASGEMQHHAQIGIWITQTVDRRNGCDDDGISAFQ